MADKAIGSLTQATTFGPSDLIVLEQDNTAKSMLGQTLVTLLGNQLQAKGGITSLTEMPEFSTSSTYELNTYVTRSGKIYKCINAITTAGSWDSTKWSEQESYSTALQIPYLIDYKVDEEYPQLADTYYRLSLAEMEHVTMLHDNVTNIINEYKRNNEVPEAMQILYEYLHERQIKWASKIKAKQEQFK